MVGLRSRYVGPPLSGPHAVGDDDQINIECARGDDDQINIECARGDDDQVDMRYLFEIILKSIISSWL
jgi:hypothetical protein